MISIPVDLMILDDYVYKEAKEKWSELSRITSDEFQVILNEYAVFGSFWIETEIDYPFQNIDWECEDCDMVDCYGKLMKEYFLADITPALQYAEVVRISPYSDLDMERNGMTITTAGRLGEMASNLPIGLLSAWTEFFFKGYYDDNSDVDLERTFYLNDDGESVIVAVPKSETLKIPKEKVLEKAYDVKIYKSLKDADVGVVEAVEKYSAEFYNSNYMRLKTDFKKRAVGEKF